MIVPHNHVKKINKLRILNCVATFSVGCLLSIKQLSTQCKHIIAPPNAFASGVGRFKYPPCVFSIFPSGKVVMTGLKRLSDAELAAVYICYLIREKGNMPDVCVNDFKITNSTLATFVGHELDIYKMHQANVDFVLNTKNYPNVIIKDFKKQISLTVPTSGRVNVLGATTLHMARVAFESRKDGFDKYILHKLSN
jgi:TATA-box binding protein (TBP) (component of TFIID and TFIIIB)